MDARDPRTFIDLEFDTVDGGAPLGDIAASLVCLHDLLRDLAAIAGDLSQVEFKEIQVVGIEMRSPLTIKLSLLGIPPAATKAFQEICREVILFREGHDGKTTTPPFSIQPALDLVLRAEGSGGALSHTETARLHSHLTTLQQAVIPLKRVVVRTE